jgi:hypothetical protein
MNKQVVKVLVIKGCRDCPHYSRGEPEGHIFACPYDRCRHPKVPQDPILGGPRIDEWKKIPTFCPLQNAPQACRKFKLR